MRYACLAALVMVSACSVDLAIPDERARVECDSNNDCPTGTVCRSRINRCVPTETDDETAPTVTNLAYLVDDETATPPVYLRAGAILSLSFAVDEPLFEDPTVAVGGYSASLDTADRNAGTYSFRYVTSGSETEGDGDLTINTADWLGNATTENAGDVHFDFEAPQVVDLVATLPAGQVAVKNSDTVSFSAQTEGDAALVVASLYASGTLLADLTAATTVEPTGTGGTAISGSVDLTPLTLEDGSHLYVGLAVADAARNQTQPEATRTDSIPVDLIAPHNPSVAVVAGETTMVASISVTFAADGATEVCLLGDVAEASESCDNAGAWGSIVSPRNLTLLSGYGDKELRAQFRDGAHNLSTLATDSVLYLDNSSPVASNPTVALPNGQTAIKTGDRLAVGGSGEAGATIHSLRFVYVDGDPATPVDLPAEAIGIDVLGNFFGEIIVPALADGERVQLEVVLSARGGLTSAPENSRTQEILIDLAAPLSPIRSNLRLVENEPVGDPIGTIDDSNNSFVLTGLTGAFVDAVAARVYATEDRTVFLHEEPVTASAMADVTLNHLTGETYWVVAVDGAGNESVPVAIKPPEFRNLQISPEVTRANATTTVSFTTDVPLRLNGDSPSMTVGGRAGSCASTGGNDYSCTFTPNANSDAANEGLDRAIVRLRGEHGLEDGGTPVYAPGTIGTTAVLTSLDFTPPVITANLLTFSQADPGAADTVIGAIGAVDDDAGSDAMLPLADQLTITATALEADQTTVIATTNVGPDGSFAELLLGDNLHDVVYLRIADAAGNTTSVQYDNDIEAPVVSSLDFTPPEQHDGGTVEFTFDVSDNLSDLRVEPLVQGTNAPRYATRTDGGTLTTGSGSVHFVYELLVNGGDAQTTHTVQVTATDEHGNSTTEVAAGTLTLDFVDPTSDNTVPFGITRWRGAPGFEGTASDTLSGVDHVELRLLDVGANQYWNGAQFVAGEQWFAATDTSAWTYDTASIGFTESGSYQLSWRAVDLAGNVETIRGPTEWLHDTAPPNTNITGNPAATTDELTATFTYDSTEPDWVYMCSLDGAAFEDCSGGATITYDLLTGDHTFNVYAIDEADNADPTPASFAWTIERNWESYSLGQDHACAIAHDHTLWCWGHNGSARLGQSESSVPDTGEPLRVGSDGDWSSVSAGFQHTCAIKDDHSLWCWGAGNYGRLGNNGTQNRSSPTEVSGGYQWSAVAAAYYHTCGIQQDATVWCWGYNGSGELGDGTQLRRLVPVQEENGWSDWTQIGAGGAVGAEGFSCGIRNGGALYCWGNNQYGQVGDGTQGNIRTSPEQEDTDSTNWKQVSVPLAPFACATKQDGRLYCWGRHGYGRLAHGTDDVDLYVPTEEIGSDGDWSEVSTGLDFACAAKNGGEVWCWGNAEGGIAFGDGVAGRVLEPRLALDGSTGWTHLEVGHGEESPFDRGNNHPFGCASKDDGHVWCWGSNRFGRVGSGVVGVTERRVPEKTVASGSWGRVSIGGHGCALDTSDNLWCWGRNQYGQLGTGTVVLEPLPTPVGAATWTDLAVGYLHTCAIDGSLWLHCWGYDVDGQLGIGGSGPDNYRTDPTRVGTQTWSVVSAGLVHTCGVRQDSQLYCWGADNWGRLGNGALNDSDTPVQEDSGSAWSTVSVGVDHSCGIKQDRTLWCWGRGFQGRLGVGDETDRQIPTQENTNATDWVQVDASAGAHTCAIRDDGTDRTLWCWGANNTGQLGNGLSSGIVLTPTQEVTQATDWAEVTTGQHTTCARTTNGEVWCWGSDSNGQVGDGPDYNTGTPVREATLATDWATVSATNSNSNSACATKTNHELWCWGNNAGAQHGDGTILYPTPNEVPRQ